MASSDGNQKDHAKEGDAIEKLFVILRRRLITDLSVFMHSYYKDNVFLGELEVYLRTK